MGIHLIVYLRPDENGKEVEMVKYSDILLWAKKLKNDIHSYSNDSGSSRRRGGTSDNGGNNMGN